MHYLCINKMHLELQRAITLTELGPSPFNPNRNIHLVDINVFAKSDEIPSLPVQDIKERQKCCGQRIIKGKNFNRIGPQPLFFFYKCSDCGHQHVCQILIKLLSLPFQVTENPNCHGRTM